MADSDKKKEAALWYCKKGFSVVPMRVAKKMPHIKWEQYQKEKADENQIADWWKFFSDANVGIVTGAISDLTVIDLDTDEAKDRMTEMFSEYDLTIPTVKSPHGEHWYFRYAEGIPSRPDIFPGCDIRSEGAIIIAPPSVNDNGGKYEWVVKANLPSELPVIPIAIFKELERVTEKSRFGVQNDHKQQHLTTADHKLLFTDGRRDNDLFHTANCLVKGGMDTEYIYQVLENLMKSWGEEPDRKWLNDKVLSAVKRDEHRNRVISEEVRDIMLTTTGHVRTTYLHNELQLTTRTEKKAANMALLRLEKDGLIEKTGKIVGEYRRIENNCEVINFKDAKFQELDFRYPLGFEQYIFTMPKSIIVIAGSQDSGKTAFLLNLIFLNQKRYKTTYYSSEMGAMELGSRLQHMKNTDMDKWCFTAKERSKNFADVIDPDGLNVIDFLEISDAFYKVGQQITDIFDRLKNGIAVIGLQKDKKSEVGRGGSFSLEKPRLYLTIDSQYPGNIIRIVKAKNWRDPEMNPNGFCRKFKIVKGINLLPEGIWGPEL